MFTLRKFKNTTMNFQGTDFLIKRVSKKNFGVTKAVWIENIKIPLSDPLQTVVDIIDDPSIGGGMRHVVDIVQEYFKSQHRNDDEIVKYIDRKNNRTVFKRLGFLIEF